MQVELIETAKCSAVYKINGILVNIWTIFDGQIATSLKNYKQTKRWNNIPKGQCTLAPTKFSWITDQTGVENWLNSAIKLQTEIDARPKIIYKEAIKRDQDILIVEVELKQRYVAVTANLIHPILESDAIECNNRCLEDSDLDQETIEEFFDTLEFFDNSLYYNDISYNDEIYLFESGACGCLHDEIKKVCPKFDRLIELHLKEDQSSYYEAVEIVSQNKKRSTKGCRKCES